jgi:hypothetical protein
MSLTVDQFTKRCVERAESLAVNSVRATDETSVGFSWITLLAPIIEAAMMMLMDRLSGCGQSTEQRIKAINSGSTLAKFQVYKAVNNAIAEQRVPWNQSAPLRVTARDAILTEAKETPDDDLESAINDIDSYNFDAADAWSFTG